jgi:hypothetical protein
MRINSVRKRILFFQANSSAVIGFILVARRFILMARIALAIAITAPIAKRTFQVMGSG